VPPANVLATPKLPVKVDASRTNGTVSQREADRWAAAFLREQAIEGWAITTGQEGLLKGGCLGASGAYDELFAAEVSTIERASAVGGHVAYDPPATVAGIAIASAPAKARDYVAALSGEEPTFAVVGTFRGPLAAYVVEPNGRRQELGHTAAGVVYRRATFGRYVQSQVGPLWFQFTADDCTSGWMAGTCAT
jgi:hypothetical protein